MAKENWEILDDYLYFGKDKYESISSTDRFAYSHFEDTESWNFFILGKNIKTEEYAIFYANEIKYGDSYYDSDLSGETEIYYRNDTVYDIGSEDEVFETWNELN